MTDRLHPPSLHAGHEAVLEFLFGYVATIVMPRAVQNA
jgi:hypothetical protein